MVGLSLFRIPFPRKNHAMGLDSHLLLQFRSTSLLANAERCDSPQKEALAQSCRLLNCRKLSATTRKRSVFGRYPGFSSALDCGFSTWKRTNREASLNRHRFAVAAVSADSDDAAQNFTEAAKCPCLYLQGTVSSGNTIRYPGTVVVSIRNIWFSFAVANLPYGGFAGVALH